MSFIRNFIDKPVIKVLTGMRRCGKSSLLKLTYEEILKRNSVNEKNILYFNFESLEYESKLCIRRISHLIFQSEIYLELPLKLFSYNTYERAYEPVSGFGFNLFKFEIVYDNDSELKKCIRYFCKRNYNP